MRLCNYLSTASNPDTLLLYAAGTQLRHEDLYAIQQQLAENKGLFKSPPVGPMSLILDDVQIHCLQQLIPACALDTILVANIYDMDSLAKLLKNKSLPVPEIEVTDLGPDPELYDNLPPLKAFGDQLLHSLPSSFANYLIDQFQIEQHDDVRKP